jgi:hypothetical protein
MAEAAFGVKYEGPALADGRMAVRDLAPALLALGDLFAEASTIAYPDRPPVALNIKATEDGSFLVHLILEAGDAWDRLVDIFGSDSATAVANLLAFIAGGKGVLWLIKTIGRRRIVGREEVTPGVIRITLNDGTTIEVPAQVFALYGALEVRRQAREVIEPLNREGVERVQFRAEEVTLVSIDRDDVPSYDVPEVEDVPLQELDVEMVVSIVSVVFTEGNKWRFSDGTNTFYAAIEDKGFVERVEHGEPFRKGDMLRSRVHITQSQRGDGLHSEYRVLEVLEHIPRAPQLRLIDPEESDEPPRQLPPGA